MPETEVNVADDQNDGSKGADELDLDADWGVKESKGGDEDVDLGDGGKQSEAVDPSPDKGDKTGDDKPGTEKKFADKYTSVDELESGYKNLDTHLEKLIGENKDFRLTTLEQDKKIAELTKLVADGPKPAEATDKSAAAAVRDKALNIPEVKALIDGIAPTIGDEDAEKLATALGAILNRNDQSLEQITGKLTEQDRTAQANAEVNTFVEANPVLKSEPKLKELFDKELKQMADETNGVQYYMKLAYASAHLELFPEILDAAMALKGSSLSRAEKAKKLVSSVTSGGGGKGSGGGDSAAAKERQAYDAAWGVETS